MDIATIIGLIGGFGIAASAMVLAGSALVFFNVPSMLIVFGGSLFAVLMKFGIGRFFSAFKVALKAFIFRADKAEDLISKSVELAGLARKNGLL